MKDFVAIQDQIQQFGLVPFFESRVRDFFHEVEEKSRLEREVSALRLFKKLCLRVRDAEDQSVTVSWTDISEGTKAERDIYNLLEGIIIQNGRIRLFKNQIEDLFFSVLSLLGLPLDSRDQREALEKASRGFKETSQVLKGISDKLARVENHRDQLISERKTLALQIAMDKRSEPGIRRIELIDKLLSLIADVRQNLEREYSVYESKLNKLERRVALLEEALSDA